MKRRLRSEDGMVTAFVVVFAFTLLMVAGLVTDGGFILAARREAIDQADAAARSGAQAVSASTLRSPGGPVVIDATAARERVASYLLPSGHTGIVTVTGDQVAVDVSFKRSMTLLGIAGFGPVTVHGHGQARSIRGTTQGDD